MKNTEKALKIAEEKAEKVLNELGLSKSFNSLDLDRIFINLTQKWIIEEIDDLTYFSACCFFEADPLIHHMLNKEMLYNAIDLQSLSKSEDIEKQKKIIKDWYKKI